MIPIYIPHPLEDPRALLTQPQLLPTFCDPKAFCVQIGEAEPTMLLWSINEKRAFGLADWCLQKDQAGLVGKTKPVVRPYTGSTDADRLFAGAFERCMTITPTARGTLAVKDLFQEAAERDKVKALLLAKGKASEKPFVLDMEECVVRKDGVRVYGAAGWQAAP